MDTDGSSVIQHRKYAQNIQAARDNIKIRKKSTAHGVELVMLGKESQEHIHYAMPMRVMGYDYGAYKKQYDDIAKKYRQAKGLQKDEFLSGMKRTDKLIPVITLVVYYGENPWDGATTLHGMLNIGNDIAPYVNDYRMLLVEARQNNLQLHNADNVDLFNLLEIIQNKNRPLRETKSRAIEYAKQHNVDRSVIMTVPGTTNCALDYDEIAKKGETGMWSVWERNMEEGRKEGRAEGIIETGYELGLSENDILKRLQNKLNISLQQAQEYLQKFQKQPM